MQIISSFEGSVFRLFLLYVAMLGKVGNIPCSHVQVFPWVKPVLRPWSYGNGHIFVYLRMFPTYVFAVKQ